MKKGNILLAGVVVLALCGFQDKSPDAYRQNIIETGVEIKVQEFKKREQKKCVDRAIETAVARVDSIMRVRAYENAVDAIEKPDRPIKPTKPPVKTVPDTL